MPKQFRGIEFQLPILSSYFSSDVQEIISMVAMVFEYDNDLKMDEITLSFMNHIFPNSSVISVKFDYTQFLATIFTNNF